MPSYQADSNPSCDEWWACDGWWACDDNGCEQHYPDATSGKAAAEEYAHATDWTDTKTSWTDIYTWRIQTGEDGIASKIDEECHTITIEPAEPDCLRGEDHEWSAPLELVGGCAENPGVWGHGGGVTIDEVCLKCGCGKTTDTWATRLDTGEQGLTSIEYKPGAYLEELSA